MRVNRTEIKIYHREYKRAPSDFNPTFVSSSPTGAIPYWYDFEKLISLNVLPPSAMTVEKLKFTVFNSNIVARYLAFTELTCEYTSTNSVFFFYFSPFKGLTVDECTISTIGFLFMTLEGVNIRVMNSEIKVESTIQVLTFQALTVCSYYHEPQYSGIANNLIFDNNTFTGRSV